METQKAISLIAEVLDVLVGNFVPDCGGDFTEGYYYCEKCKDYSLCKKGTKAQNINSKLQSLLVDIEPVHIWVDGWCKNNGKPSAKAGWSVIAVLNGKQDSCNKSIVSSHYPQTNNVAEYRAFINGLHWGKQYNRPIIIHTDSALVIGQVIDCWKVDADHLQPLVEEARTLVAETYAEVIKEPREKIVEILGH